MTAYQVQIRGEMGPDDGLVVDMGPLRPGQAWWDVPLPPCPDCGGDLTWDEAGHAPGTRKCLGLPVGGRPTNPLLDARVPLPDGAQHRGQNGLFPGGDVGAHARALFGERNECSDARVEAIDRELIVLLYPWMRLSYDDRGGCGSLFNVQVQNGRVIVQREQFR